jgi:hypothetical protein
MEPSKPESSGSAKKWLIGCGIGCGAVILIVALLIVAGVFFVKDLVKGFEESEEILQALTEKYGDVADFVPDPSGVIPRQRMEKFLEVRGLMRPVVEELERDITSLSDQVEGDGDPQIRREGFIGKLRTGFGLVPKLAEFLKVRNQALLDMEMGLGEYFYIYTLSYYSWMKKPVIDGPPFALTGEERGYRFRDWDEDETEDVRRDLMLRRLNRMLLAMLRNQAAAARESDADSGTGWTARLAGEIEAMEADRYRMVWQDGLPEEIENSLRPFKDRLEKSYSPLLNSLEVTIEQR